MLFQYKISTDEGKVIYGEIEANDASQAATYLRSKGYYPIRITAKTGNGFLNLPFLNRTSSSDLVLLTRQLSSMLASGLTLMQALHILQKQIKNEQMNRILLQIVSDVEEGKPLSEALAKHPEIFSHIYIAIIKAGEASGLLDKMLARLADNLEKHEELKSTIRSALLYPIIIVIGMVVVTALMMIFVIPKLSEFYVELKVDLPLPTQIIIVLSNIFAFYWPFVIGAGFLIYLAFVRWHKTESGKLLIDSMILKLPVFGKLQSQIILTEFTRTLGLLIGSGALVVDAFKQTADITGNVLYQNAILSIAKRVEKGVTIGDAMQAYQLFPPIILQMVKIGEQTGKLDESLTKSSEYFEREVNQTVKTLTTALEPILMGVLGIGVGFLIWAIITPIYTLTSKF